MHIMISPTERLGMSTPPAFNALRTKIGNSLRTRLRTGISQLNSHLFQINKCATPACSCDHPNENTRHFILHCPNYDHQRHQLFRNVSQILGTDFSDISPPQQIRILLHGESLDTQKAQPVAKQFQNYILGSRRFTATH